MTVDKLYIKNKEINYCRNIAKIIKESGSLNESDFAGNIENLYDIFELDKSYSLNFVCQIINIYYLESKLILKYVSRCGEANFSHNRFKQYLIHSKKHHGDNNSETVFKLIYGDEYLEHYNKRKSKPKSSIYDPNYIMKKYNLTYDQALQHVKEYKKNKSTSKENFIKKHGVEDGLKKFEKFQQTSKHTKEKYLSQYGEDVGTKKWEEYVHLKKITSNRCIEYWLAKYPNIEEAEYYKQQFHRDFCNTSSVDFWVNKGMDLEGAIQKVKNIMLKKQVSFCNASKESLKYFQPLYDELIKQNKKVMMGVEGNEEMLLYDHQNKKIRFYDFAIFPEKLIIEFHGYKFHPNPDKLSEEEWSNWKCGRLDRNYNVEYYLTADEAHQIDLHKQKLAESKGFKYLIIWSDDKKDINIEKILLFLSSNNLHIDSSIFK